MPIRRKIALFLLCVAAFLCAAAVGWHYYLCGNTERFRKKLLAEGEFLSMTQPWPGSLHGDREKASAFLQAVMQLRGGAVLSTNQVRLMRSVAFDRAIVGSSMPEIRDYKSLTNSWQDLAAELKLNAGLLDEIRGAVQGSSLDFNLYYPAGFEIPLPHLARAKRSSQIFAMATALALHQKELELAKTNLLTMISLSKAFHQDRFMITELVQIAMAHIAAGATWEALQTPGWQESQLKLLQEEWLKLEFIQPMHDSFTLETAMTEDTLRDFRSRPHKMLQLCGLGGKGSSGGPADIADELLGGTFRAGLGAIWSYYWSYDDELRFLQIAQMHQSAFNQTNPSWKSASALIDKRLAEIQVLRPTQSEEPYYFDTREHNIRSYFSNTAADRQSCIRRAFGAQTLKEIVATAVALERFRLQHGGYPDKLELLVPSLLPRLPIDYMDAQPLRYRLEPDRTCTLYSVGADTIDNEGRAGEPSPTPRGWTLERDWVWPHPATPAEVTQFETKEAAKFDKTPPSTRRKATPKVQGTNN